MQIGGLRVPVHCLRSVGLTLFFGIVSWACLEQGFGMLWVVLIILHAVPRFPGSQDKWKGVGGVSLKVHMRYICWSNKFRVVGCWV